MTAPMGDSSVNHFEDKEVLQHVVEKRAKGITQAAETHGTETPGHISAGADAAREMGLLMGVASILALSPIFLVLLALSWVIWKAGRCAWLGWARLERLHRIIEQERYEITHHRSQEREELDAIYSTKGFKDKLLEEVVDVLMADEDRLLLVMLEEELGLGLATYEHPLKQALGAGIGALSAGLLCLLGLFIPLGVLIGSLLSLALGAVVSARFEGNRLLPAVIWNMALGGLVFGIVFSALQLVMRL